jgi:aminodeoxyfutalosine synthase
MTLSEIATKVEAGERLTREEGLELLTSGNTEEVGRLADLARQRTVGDTCYFATTLYIHPTNLCELSCPMCSFYAKPGWESAWFLEPAEIEKRVREGHANGITEVHIVGGLWRDCDLDYYKETFTRIKSIDPALHIKAMTPVEYDFLAKLHGIPVDEVFRRMMEWGLGSLPGGGAEILVEEIRKQLAPQKITSDEYMAIHRIAHELGLPSNITMLFGHVEEPHHIIEHLCQVRELQDITGGFRTFVPLKYHVENNALGKRKKRLKEPLPLPLVYATSRLMLDNVPNLKVLWNYVGVEMAQQLLHFGANDFSSTNEAEKIITMAGGIRVEMTRDTIADLIRQAGRTPKEIHSGHDYAGDRQCALAR